MTDGKKPIHEADQLADDVMDQASEQLDIITTRHDTRLQRRQSKKTALLAAALFTVIVLVIYIFPDRDIALSGEELSYYMIDEMNTLVYDLSDYRENQGAFPEKLAQIGMPDDPAWSYRRLDENRYRILFRDDGQTLIYASEDSADLFFAEVRGIE